MENLRAVLGLAAVGIFLIYRYILYPAWLSPLAKLPSPHRVCSLFNWMEYQRSSSRELKALYAAHERLGPIILVGPDEVSVVSQDALKKIYIAGLDKHTWYKKTFYNYGHPNLVCILDHKTHSTQKRMLAKLYSKSHLQRSENMANLSERIILQRLCPMLQRFAQNNSNVDVVQIFEWTSADFITAYLFGTSYSTDFLHNKECGERYFRDWSKKQGSSCTYAEEVCMRMCKAVLTSKSEGKRSIEAELVVFSTMYKAAAAEAALLEVTDADVLTRCASEMLDHMIATQETNTITLTYILYRLSLDPDLQSKLRKEIFTVEPSIRLASDPEGNLPPAAAIDKLPLLNAVVYETLRIHAANPARMLRVVPASGLELHGYYIPPSTTISTNAYCLHRSPQAYPRPLDWLPQRWLPPDHDQGAPSLRTSESSRAEAMRWFWAFGSGPRMCIGNNFATQVIKLTVAAIYSQYTTSVVDDTGIEQTDSYNSGPASHRLILRFHAVFESRDTYGT